MGLEVPERRYPDCRTTMVSSASTRLKPNGSGRKTHREQEQQEETRS